LYRLHINFLLVNGRKNLKRVQGSHERENEIGN
jgi:hypothetical protein